MKNKEVMWPSLCSFTAFAQYFCSNLFFNLYHIHNIFLNMIPEDWCTVILDLTLKVQCKHIVGAL